MSVSAAPAYAQIGCTPTRLEFAAWGPNGASGRIVWGNSVPAGRVWRIETAGLATEDGRVLDWALQLYSNGHYHPFAVETARGSTPVLAYTGPPRHLVAGEFLGGRVNAPDDFGNATKGLGMALLYTGWDLPAECLARSFGLEPVTVTSGGTPTPDFSVLVQAIGVAVTEMTSATGAMTGASSAITNAASALHAVAASVPPQR